jgi:hypothetical protein
LAFSAESGYFFPMRTLRRVVVPEILDSLPADDPRARRSRRDLRAVDAFMGNTRWILRKIRSLPEADGTVVELGAGDGRLAARLAGAFSRRRVVALDLAGRPVDLDRRVDWVRGDFFRTLAQVDGEICAGSLVLHHFQDDALDGLGRRMRDFRTLVFCEPLRSRVALGLAALAWPFSGAVTRHDMPASIRAGFVPGELPRRLGLEASRWDWNETATRRGGLRFFATRRG